MRSLYHYAEDLSSLAAAIDAHGRALGERLAAWPEAPAAALGHLQASDIAAQRLRQAAEALAALARLSQTVDGGLTAPGLRLQAMQVRGAANDFLADMTALAAIAGPSAEHDDLPARLETLSAAIGAEAAGTDHDGTLAERRRLIERLPPRYTTAAEHAILASFLAGGTTVNPAPPTGDAEIDDAFL